MTKASLRFSSTCTLAAGKGMAAPSTVKRVRLSSLLSARLRAGLHRELVAEAVLGARRARMVSLLRLGEEVAGRAVDGRRSNRCCGRAWCAAPQARGRWRGPNARLKRPPISVSVVCCVEVEVLRCPATGAKMSVSGSLNLSRFQPAVDPQLPAQRAGLERAGGRCAAGRRPATSSRAACGRAAVGEDRARCGRGRRRRRDRVPLRSAASQVLPPNAPEASARRPPKSRPSFDVVAGDRQQAVDAAALLGDHIGDHRLALHVDAGRAAADHVDARHLGGRDALQDVVEGVGLGRPAAGRRSAHCPPRPRSRARRRRCPARSPAGGRPCRARWSGAGRRRRRGR